MFKSTYIVLYLIQVTFDFDNFPDLSLKVPWPQQLAFTQGSALSK